MTRDITERPWGRYELIRHGPTDNGYIKVKLITLNPLSSMAIASAQ